MQLCLLVINGADANGQEIARQARRISLTIQRLRESEATQTASSRHKGSSQTSLPPVTAAQLRVRLDNSRWLRRPQDRFSWNFDDHARGSLQQSRSAAIQHPTRREAGPQQALTGAREPATTGACTDSRVSTGVSCVPATSLNRLRNLLWFFNDKN